MPVKDDRLYCQCGCGERAKPGRRFILGHHIRSKFANTKITKDQRSAILGSLLGDSSIAYGNRHSKMPRITANHSYKQIEWSTHKANFLASLGATVRVKPNGGYGDKLASMQTKSCRVLVAIHELTHGSGRKRVTREWMDGIGDIGMAWWICDDGAKSSRGVFLHTNSYDLEEQKIFKRWIESRYGGEVSILQAKGKYWFLNIRAKCATEMGKRIRKHVPDCMQYKLEGC